MKFGLFITLAAPLIFGVACKSFNVEPGAPQQRVPKIQSNWPDTAYTEVRAYNYDPFTSHGAEIVDDERLAPVREPTAGRLLNASQTTRLLDAIKNQHSPHQRAFCHHPRHGFVFFEGTEIVAQLSICFECGSYTASPSAGVSAVWDLGAIRSILEELQLWHGRKFEPPGAGALHLGPGAFPNNSSAAPDNGSHPFVPPGGRAPFNPPR